MSNFSKLLYFTICFAFFVFATLCFSDVIVANIVEGLNFTNDIFTLKYVENTGAAFSILKDARELLIIVSVAAICGIFSYVIRHLSSMSLISMFFWAMLAAGIGGNLHERIAFGFVRDYILLNFVEFPVFNISDILINISVIALILILLKKKL